MSSDVQKQTNDELINENATGSNNDEVIDDEELRLIEDEILETSNWRNANNHNNLGKKHQSDSIEVNFFLYATDLFISNLI